jgi:hypothetical protein
LVKLSKKRGEHLIYKHFTMARGGKRLDMTHSLYHIKADLTPQVPQKLQETR